MRIVVRRMAAAGAVALAATLLTGCFRWVADGEGSLTQKVQLPRRVEPRDVMVPPGYRVEAVAHGLTFPTAIAFDDAGTPYVTESGYSYGDVFREPRLLRIDAGGKTVEVAKGDRPPWTGVTFHGGAFYVAEGGVVRGGGQPVVDARIVKIGRDGAVTPVVTGLPPGADHHTNGPVVGPDELLYFSVGTATNSGVVGVDNHEMGWLADATELHDPPCRDVKLTGENFKSANPLTPEPDDEVVTGAFVPFGTRTEPGQTIPAATPCRGAVYKVPLSGGTPELVAWGLRNPYGLAFTADGRLFVTENGFDVRGSRPVFGSGDHLWEVKPGTWYGWPDFSGGMAVYTDEHKDWFTAPDHPRPPRLLAEHPNEPPKPAALFGVHSSSNHFDFSRSDAFGYAGEAFVAQFGDLAPMTGDVMRPVGFRVVRANVENGVVKAFAANRGRGEPASIQGGGGLERPVAARFDPSGQALYVVDFGVMTKGPEGIKPFPETGVVWRISRDAATGGAR